MINLKISVIFMLKYGRNYCVLCNKDYILLKFEIKFFKLNIRYNLQNYDF